MEGSATAQVKVQTLPGQSAETVILKVTGPLTIYNFFDFQKLTRETKARILLIDLSDVPYIDSAAMGSLVGVHVSRESSGGKYAIVGANNRLKTAFEVTNISTFLVLYPTVEEAEAALA